jgi:hypothetical protein
MSGPATGVLMTHPAHHHRTHSTRRMLLLCALLSTIAGCTSSTAPDVPASATRVVGTVHFYTIEGGFWAVKGDDGVVYEPMGGLPSAFQQEDLRVTMVVKVRTDLAGIHMAGPIVEIIQIQRA